jgi:tetratricopeptide (TPR) repeat protein
LADAEKALGPDHFSVGMCAASLGELERQEGHSDRAQSLLERAIGIFERVDPSGAVLSEPYTGLGLIAESRGQLDLALEDLRRARAALSKGTGTVVLDPDPEYVRVLRKVGRTAEAERVEASMKARTNTP